MQSQGEILVFWLFVPILPESQNFSEFTELGNGVLGCSE
jgi:hypothetical protein